MRLREARTLVAVPGLGLLLGAGWALATGRPYLGGRFLGLAAVVTVVAHLAGRRARPAVQPLPEPHRGPVAPARFPPAPAGAPAAPSRFAATPTAPPGADPAPSRSAVTPTAPPGAGPAPSRFASPPAAPPGAGPAPSRFAVPAQPLFRPAAARPELTPLRSTTVESLRRAEPEEETQAAPEPVLVPDGGERRWGSPAAPGSATHVLPQRGRRRRPELLVPARDHGPASRPTGYAAGNDDRPRSAAEQPTEQRAEQAAERAGARPAGRAAAVQQDGPTPATAAATAARAAAPGAPPAPPKPDLTPRPDDPRVGRGLLTSARARLTELEPALMRSWLASLDAAQRGEPTGKLSAGQVAVLAAGLESTAVRKRLLRAVGDPLADAVGLLTSDAAPGPVDGSVPAGRATGARELFLLVARTTTGTPAQGAAVRALSWLDRQVVG